MSSKPDPEAKHEALLTAAFCAVWQISIGWIYMLGALDVVFAGASGLITVTSWFGIDLPADNERMLALLATMTGAGIGGVVQGLFFLQYYAAERGLFTLRYAFSYILVPLAVPLTGLVAYALIGSGILVFAPNDSASGDVALNDFAYLALGILAGASWENINSRIEDAANNIFGKTKRSLSKSKEKQSVNVSLQYKLDSGAETKDEGERQENAAPAPQGLFGRFRQGDDQR